MRRWKWNAAVAAAALSAAAAAVWLSLGFDPKDATPQLLRLAGALAGAWGFGYGVGAGRAGRRPETTAGD
jgi:hypothetical protein